MVGPAYGANAQADVPPPYEEPVYENAAEGEGPRMDAPPVQLLRGPEDGDRARLEQVTFNACRHCGKIYSDPDPQYSWSLYLFLIKTQKKFFMEEERKTILLVLWSFRRIWVWRISFERRSRSLLFLRLWQSLEQDGGPPAAWAVRCWLAFPPALAVLSGCIDPYRISG